MNVYKDSEDKNVAINVLYGDVAAGKVYYDSEKTKEVAMADIPNLYLKGFVVYVDGSYVKPVGLQNGAPLIPGFNA